MKSLWHFFLLNITALPINTSADDIYLCECYDSRRHYGALEISLVTHAYQYMEHENVAVCISLSAGGTKS